MTKGYLIRFDWAMKRLSQKNASTLFYFPNSLFQLLHRLCQPHKLMAITLFVFSESFAG